MTSPQSSNRTVIVGGGLAGLSAAAILARAGQKKVSLFERSSREGGRATTQDKDGFFLNQGPHALYTAGPAHEVLTSLGVSIAGGKPRPPLSLAFYEHRLYRLPDSARTLLFADLFGPKAKVDAARALVALSRAKPGSLDSTTYEQWVSGITKRPEVRAYLYTLMRLTTFINAPEEVAASAVIAQLQSGQRGGVLYLDGGWQSLVDGVAEAARTAGAEIDTACRVERVVPDGEGWRVLVQDGGSIPAANVILAVSPKIAAQLLPADAAPGVQDFAARALPVRAATLDIGLRRLPFPDRAFALGLDRPYYLSVHSYTARVAPAGTALVSLAKYLHPSEKVDPSAVQKELEGFLDIVQPGWRRELVMSRFLPELVAANAVVRAADGGLAGRPAPVVPGVRGLYLAGDWVGPTGVLLDAALNSARAAAGAIIASAAEPAGHLQAVA